MQKGIVLFDIQDFLYQGMKERPSIEQINERQAHALEVIHSRMLAEQKRRRSSQIPVPTVDIFLPTGDGYYMLCTPELGVVLDIAHCIMAMLYGNDISAYCVAHMGEVNVFTDMSGRENATGFDIGYANRLQEVSQQTAQLTCSERLVSAWRDNHYFDLDGAWRTGVAKDHVEYRWMTAVPKDFEAACARFAA